MSEPKERPILFSGEMVRAILEGRKTQTRRIVKDRKDWAIQNDNTFGKVWGNSVLMDSPFGKPGDRLWVRETFINDTEADEQPCFYFKADCENPEIWRWSPSIHMPRSAARIFLEITNIRVERLNDISEEDAKAEGIVGGKICINGSAGWGSNEKMPDVYKSKWSFAELWESINGKDSWKKNPWVWVIEFKKLGDL